MANSVRVEDHGYEAMLARLAAAAEGRAVDVGVMGSQASASHGEATNADVATWMEFGTSNGVPARSWLRDYIDQNRERLEEMIRRMMREVVTGRLKSIDQGFNLIGLKVVDEIKARITAGIAPPNSPVTVALKGSSTPLIDTGQFLSSITYALRELAQGL